MSSRSRASTRPAPRETEHTTFIFSTPSKPRPPKTPPKSPPSYKITCSKDIVTIDAVIKSIFRKKAEGLPVLDAKIADLRDIAEYSADPNDRRRAVDMARALESERSLLATGLGLTLYSAKTSGILNTYKSLTQSFNFGTGEVITPASDHLVASYLSTARQFASLEIPKEILETRQRCAECESREVVIEGGHYICAGCHASSPVLDDTSGADQSLAPRYSYTPRTHMKDAIEKFSCATGNVSCDVIEGVRQAMRNHNLTPTTVTKNFIYAYLTDSKKTEAYSQINYVYCEITGKPPPDIEKYTDELLEMSDQFEKAFKIVEPGRSNSMTVLWKLYMFLCLLDFPCSRDDFYCLKIPEKQEDREYDWNRTIDLLMKMYPAATTSHNKKRWRHLTNHQEKFSPWG